MEDNKTMKEMKCRDCERVRKDRTEEFWSTVSGRDMETYYLCPLHIEPKKMSKAHKRFLEKYPDGIRPKGESEIPTQEELEKIAREMTEQKKPDLEQWEYCMYKVPPHDEEYVRIEPEMCRLGKDGNWKLVSVDQGIAYFGRRVQK